MRKMLACLILLNACLLYGQEVLNVPAGSIIHELPGNHFLASRIVNSKVYLTEYTSDGTETWTDSLGFSVPTDTISGFVFTRFGNTAKYAAILYKTSPGNGPKIYRFSMLDISSHVFTGDYTDTIQSLSILAALPKNDTSIYLLVPQSGGEAFYQGFATKLLSSNMTVTDVAPVDSMQIYYGPADSKFYKIADTIFRISGGSADVYVTGYDASISNTSNYFTQVPGAVSIPDCHFRELINADSVLVFTSGANAWNSEWRLTLLDRQLELIDSQSYSIPVLTVQEGSPASTYTLRKVVVSQDRVYAFASNSFFNNQSRIWVYDFHLDLVCEIPVTSSYDHRQSLEVINDRVYFKTPAGLSELYFETNACQFTNGVGEMPLPESILISPNPSSDRISIEVRENLVGNRFAIFDQQGNKIFGSVLETTNMQVDISALAAGIYFLYFERHAGPAIKVVKN